jgi:uncharacterized protein YeaO (DUF488 family)
MPAHAFQVSVKRVYDEPATSDGFRVLVDRLWPRGLTKEKAHVDLWLKEVAPSNELRKWFHANPDLREFRARYLKELRQPSAAEALGNLYELLESKGRLSLLFSSRNLDHNNATVLRDFIQGMKKPPKGTGPIRGARTLSKRRAAR